MSAGLDASTVTPGNTAPVVSRATPAMAPDDWAATRLGWNSTIAASDTAIEMASLFDVINRTLPQSNPNSHRPTCAGFTASPSPMTTLVLMNIEQRHDRVA